jgi:type IV secretory pathway VirD2 relaxase
MATRDDDSFRVKPAPPKSRAGPRSQRFVSQVLGQVSKAGAKASTAARAPSSAAFGRGRVAAGLAGQALRATARRVVIKSRYVVLKKAGASAVSAHLRYIERDGVTRDGERGQAYAPDTDTADLRAFEDRGRGDRHQFRFIVSVEDAEQLDDLREYSREFMKRMATDLETKLDWVAVDHWDTDNPHTHVVLRGRATNGQDLVIAPSYMAHGMRNRATELATEWLGPRTELEIRQGLLREVEQERLTSLDRGLLRRAVAGIVDLTEVPDGAQRPPILRARLQRLEALALAERIHANRWHLAPEMERTLTALGERGDILRTMHKALKAERRELAVEAGPTAPVVGRIVSKGLVDEMHDRGYLVVDGTDGRAHYLKLPAGADLAGLPVGGIVEARPPGQARAVDCNIVALVKDGIYRTTEHLTQLERAAHPDPSSTVGVHVRRLEALRRAGIVERMAEGVWKVPTDLAQRAQQHELQSADGLAIELRSRLPIDQQVRAMGATWLDRQLVGNGRELAAVGFGSQVREALHSRVNFLAEHGLAERHGLRIVLARNLLSTLRDRELAIAARTLRAETGLVHRPLREGEHVSGVYRRSIQLASGRFAMLDDGVGFSLVPWRPVVEQRLGQQVSAIVRGQAVTWGLGRRRGIGI